MTTDTLRVNAVLLATSIVDATVVDIRDARDVEELAQRLIDFAKPRWIDPRDEMPEPDTDIVLLVCGLAPLIGRYSPGLGWRTTAWVQVFEVLGWMPLPEEKS